MEIPVLAIRARPLATSLTLRGIPCAKLLMNNSRLSRGGLHIPPVFKLSSLKALANARSFGSLKQQLKEAFIESVSDMKKGKPLRALLPSGNGSAEVDEGGVLAETGEGLKGGKSHTAVAKKGAGTGLPFKTGSTSSHLTSTESGLTPLPSLGGKENSSNADKTAPQKSSMTSFVGTPGELLFKNNLGDIGSRSGHTPYKGVADSSTKPTAVEGDESNNGVTRASIVPGIVASFKTQPSGLVGAAAEDRRANQDSKKVDHVNDELSPLLPHGSEKAMPISSSVVSRGSSLTTESPSGVVLREQGPSSAVALAAVGSLDNQVRGLGVSEQ